MDVLEQLLTEARTRRRLPDPAVRRVLRRRAGLTQEALAQVLAYELGHPVSRVSVTRYETGLRDPRGATCAAYVRLLERLAAENATDRSPGAGRR
jgi:DNA-binding XRE family transcriptional regulator